MNLNRLREAEAAFLQRYPGGFANPDLVALRNRKHKPEQMITLARELFARENFRQPDRIVEGMLKVITRASIVSVFEKARFRDSVALLAPAERHALSSGLELLLYADEQTGFDMVLDRLKGGKVAKWTLMTVCQTYFHPQRDVFIKPTTVRGVIEYFELENLSYRPTPSWAFYEAYRATFHEMKSKVARSLSPTNPAFSGFLFMSLPGRLL